jgi:hypothetical protein
LSNTNFDYSTLNEKQSGYCGLTTTAVMKKNKQNVSGVIRPRSL